MINYALAVEFVLFFGGMVLLLGGMGNSKATDMTLVSRIGAIMMFVAMGAFLAAFFVGVLWTLLVDQPF